MKRILCVLLALALAADVLTFPAFARDITGPVAGYGTVCYEIDGVSDPYSVRAGQPVVLRSEYAMRQYGDRILVGWETQDGRKLYYDNTDFWPDGKTDLTLQNGESCTLTPIWCPIALRKEEVFSFTNSERYFNAEFDGYLFTRQHFLRIFPNWFCTFALSPFAPAAALLCTFFLFIWPTFPFIGSCCGFPISALLQHYGKLDLLSEQGVSNVCDLQPDDSIQSIINYYNIHALATWPANHVALQSGTEEYTRQLHMLYDTLEGGTPAYFELYGDGEHMLRTLLLEPETILEDYEDLTAHGILMTGAYTDANGYHILITYDSNSMQYVRGSCNILYIDPDFTQIYSTYAYERDYALEGFTWTSELSQYDAFKPEGISNPFAWHIQFLKNFPSLFRQLVTMYKTR